MQVHRLGLAVLILFGLAGAPQAHPVIGPTYPIGEADAITTIEARLNAMRASGELARLERTAIERTRRSIDAPRVARDLPEAKRLERHLVDPSIQTSHDIRDDRHAVLLPAGTRVNPLDYQPLTQRLVFLDGRRERQVEALRSLLAKDARVKPILVAGNPIALTRRLQRTVFFDQNAALVERFSIRALPAIVRAEGKHLVVESLPPAALSRSTPPDASR